MPDTLTPDELKALDRWTADHCAAYLGISKRHFVDQVSKAPGFPKPYLRISQKVRFWRPEDVCKAVEVTA